ncbi:hypothetical protein Hanom_Chr14g01261421 [Helianthus anomalus]
MNPVIQSWRYDENTYLVSVVWNNGEKEAYPMENIMTEQRLVFLQELCNATCLNPDMTVKLALLTDMLDPKR